MSRPKKDVQNTEETQNNGGANNDHLPVKIAFVVSRGENKELNAIARQFGVTRDDLLQGLVQDALSKDSNFFLAIARQAHVNALSRIDNMYALVMSGDYDTALEVQNPPED